ncbi:RluA family pseudouridine synthase [Paenalcaligenes niemegkensis]|uniref:RluA family pseudouridine synthase n=1 Tax=Paenalcaligenes niemegkensis TaxID=2895469 RepID=UPI001EE7F053|nr:RluA family pseudouridine synthase [Paenalcaligenes niemegkensis]MCQ9616899.1 RluA family pseudouridine synthase [Paenalcaligenes niemegkensis]
MPLLDMSKPLDIDNQVPRVRFVEIEPELAGQRVDNYLIRECRGVPKSHIYKAIRGGQVRVNKGRVSSDYRLQSGDLLRIPPMRLAQRDETLPVPPAVFPIVYEDQYLLVIDKPQGVAVHGGSGVSFGVIEQLRAARPAERFLELAHRLDRDTSGLLIVARRRNALVELHDMFREGRVDKFYQALVVGDWVNDRQHIRDPLLRWMTASGERRVKVHPEGKASHTVINLLARYGRYSLLEADLKTGRTHQIRVHLANLGFSIVGDDKYGSDQVREHFVRLGFKRMFLHSSRLQMNHPITGERLELSAPLPAECQEVLRSLEKAA